MEKNTLLYFMIGFCDMIKYELLFAILSQNWVWHKM